MTSTNKVDALSDVAVCYLCLDGGADETSQSLRRDCAFRGTDAGYVHLECLAGFAASKSKQARDMIECIKPWRLCPGCHQEYQNELAVDIAAEFVPFVRRQYPDDTRMQVEALNVKLRVLNSMFERLQPRQKREFGVTANVMLSLIDRMKGDISSLSRRYSQFEARAYDVHGEIALNEGTEESARRAEVHFRTSLKVCEATGDTDGIAAAKSNIAMAKSIYEGGNNEEVLKANKELYELRVAKHGEGSKLAINSGKNYAIDLQEANRGDEALELLTKLLATSRQVLGPHHNTTKEVEATLNHVLDTLGEV